MVYEVFMPPGVLCEFRVEGGGYEVVLLDSHHRPLGLQSPQHLHLGGRHFGDARSSDENAMKKAHAIVILVLLLAGAVRVSASVKDRWVEGNGCFKT